MLEYAPHNLLLQSQTFDNASWLKSNSSITANAIAAPDGTVTADKLVEAATTSVHSATQAVTFAANFIYTASVYAKAGERSFLIIQPTSDSRFAYYNLSNGTVGTVNGSPLSTQIQSVGNNWYRCTITVTSPGATAANCILYSAATDGNATYTGDGTSGIYLWGAQLSVGPYALDYTPTTSAAVYGPRFDFDPVTLAPKGLLVEEQRQNLVTYSEDFSNAAWTKNNCTVTANSVASPDGTVNADTVTSTSTTTAVELYGSATISSGASYTLSCFVKAGTYSKAALRCYNGGTSNTPLALFNLTTKSVIATYGNVTATSVQDYGNGWLRCIMTFTSTGTNANPQINGLADTYTIDAGYNYVATLGSNGSVYAWGAQLE